MLTCEGRMDARLGRQIPGGRRDHLDTLLLALAQRCSGSGSRFCASSTGFSAIINVLALAVNLSWGALDAGKLASMTSGPKLSSLGCIAHRYCWVIGPDGHRGCVPERAYLEWRLNRAKK